MLLRAATLTAPSHRRQMMRLALASVVPRRRLLFWGPEHEPSVCLTFDDGPDAVATPRVLDALKAAGAKATFFVQGNRAVDHPDLIRRIHDEGHALGHHSWSHSHPATTSARVLAAETRQVRRLLRDTVGVDSSLFRPPHGKLSPGKLLRLWSLSQNIVLWSYDPGDVFRASTDEFTQWCTTNPPRAGDVILLHDRAPATVAGLPMLLNQCRDLGLKCTTVSAWVR